MWIALFSALFSNKRLALAMALVPLTLLLIVGIRKWDGNRLSDAYANGRKSAFREADSLLVSPLRDSVAHYRAEIRVAIQQRDSALSRTTKAAKRVTHAIAEVPDSVRTIPEVAEVIAASQELVDRVDTLTITVLRVDTLRIGVTRIDSLRLMAMGVREAGLEQALRSRVSKKRATAYAVGSALLGYGIGRYQKR